MADARFEERLKRIDARERAGAKCHLLAGVGEVDTAIRAAQVVVRPARRPASLLLVLLGALTGFLAFDILRNLPDVQAVLALPLEEIAELLHGEPTTAAAALVLALCALVAVSSVLRGRKAVRMMSFSCAAVGAAIGAALPMLA